MSTLTFIRKRLLVTEKLRLYLLRVLVSFAVSLEPFFILLGKSVFYFTLFFSGLVLLGFFLVVHSFRTETFPFPRLMLIALTVVEGLVKGLFRFFRMDEGIVDEVGINLRNKMALRDFTSTPFCHRMVFLPQCLRSLACPAKLGVEGIECVYCGACNIGEVKSRAERMGYRVFIVPGSSFIERMVKIYRPKAIIGIGCKTEVKNGLDIFQSHGLPVIGVTLKRAGCVSTDLDWDDLYDHLHLGDSTQPVAVEEAIVAHRI